MDLHDHVTLVVLLCKEDEHRVLVLGSLICSHSFTVHGLLQDRIDLRLLSRSVCNVTNAVVSNGAAHGLEEIETVSNCLLEGIHIADGDAGSLGKLCDVRSEGRKLDVVQLVRSPCRKYLYVEACVVLDLLMPLEGIDRVIGGADELYVRLLDDVPYGHGRIVKLLVAEVPYFLCSIAVQVALVAEVLTKLEVRPVVERVTDELRKGLCPHLELLAVRLVTGDVLLRYAVDTHLSPLVVVTDWWLSEPYLVDVIVALIRCDILRIDVTVVIENRCLLCDLVIELLRYIG